MKAEQLLTKKTELAIFKQIKYMLNDYNIYSVAATAGVSQQTLYNWYNGITRFPQLRTIVKVAHALGYELELKRKSKPALRLVK